MRRISQCPRVLTHKTLLLSFPLSSSEKLFDYYNYKLYSPGNRQKSLSRRVTIKNCVPNTELPQIRNYKFHITFPYVLLFITLNY